MKAVWGRSETKGEGFVKEVGFNREWNREGVMDEQSGETKDEEVMYELKNRWVGNTGTGTRKRLTKRWRESLFQRPDEA